MTKLGFGECANIAIYQNITGEKISEFDEDFYIDTFGIMGLQNEHQKIRFEIG